MFWKMAEDPKQRTDCLSTLSSTRHQQGPEDICGTLSQKHMPSHLSKEELHKQQQKSELKRLLKHTHPELKTLDQVVDEELAEVLGSEIGVTAGETGYEGEVLSRRLLFENCALSSKVSPYIHKMHVAERTTEKSNVCKKPAEFEEHAENTSVQGFNKDDKIVGSSLERECEEEVMRIDVQATRRMFENQSGNTQPLYPDKKYQGKVFISGDETRGVQRQETRGVQKQETRGVQKQEQQSEKCRTESLYGQNQRNERKNSFEDEPASLPEQDEFGEAIKTSAALFQNNPFIHTNIEREQSLVHTSKHESPAGDSGADQNYQVANVKNRTHVFESMPFHKIRHQNQDEIETMVENIKETLTSLFHVNIIHSGGSIIEVNETMLAKKAKFTLSEKGPEITYDEVAEGGAQNLILQLLPRANLKPQITYLKEGSNRSMEATVVNVPVHQHQYTSHQDTEFKTANVVQVVEDILNQDNSLRKGVIFQEYGDGCAEVIVYSLYKYFDEEDVKSYSPPQDAECETLETKRREVGGADNQEPQTGFAESKGNRLLQTSHDPTCQGAIRPEIAIKGNVKLFKSCIEKGDLEYLKTLQADSSLEEQEVPPNLSMAAEGRELYHEERDNQVEESTSEWVPVDVKKLKNMFSGDGRTVQPKQHKYLYENHPQSATVSPAITSPNVAVEKSQSSKECSTEVFLHSQVKDTFRQCDDQTQGDACDLPAGPRGSSLLLETQDGDMVHQAELVEVVDDNNEISDLQAAIHSLQQATNEAKSLHRSSQEKHSLSDGESESKEVVQQQLLESASMSVHSSEMMATQQDDEEVVFQGKLKAALDSLERSNINVTRGDFRAAMIYRNTKPKPQKEQSQPGIGASVQQTPVTELKPVADPKPTQEPMKDEVSKKQVMTENDEPPNQSKTQNKPSTSPASERKRNPTCPKPEILPKPEHLKIKPRGIQSTITETPETTKTRPIRTKGTVLQPSANTPLSKKNEHQHDSFKNDSGGDSGLNSEDNQRNELADTAKQMSQENEARIQVQGPVITLAKDDADKNIINHQEEMNASLGGKALQDVPNKESMGETDESPVDFHEACKKFESKKAFSVKSAPVKPKRVKIAQAENKNLKQKSGENSSSINTQVGKEPNKKDPLYNNPKSCGQTADGKGKHEEKIVRESKVEMREKKRPTETEDERRQRLSVHMDEIMRGNMTAAMEIFDNLRKREELQNILCQVEEIEQDTCEVDVRSLRNVFESVPDWVVGADKKKPEKEKVESKEDRLLPTRAESNSSMAHVFGDLERASEEIITLKEQTLTRLLNIEETIKKALCSVSTLKSDSDIAGLSSLFKESLGTVPGSPSFGNIRKISIGSSRTKAQPTKGNPAEPGNTAGPVSASVDEASSKQQSPPSSPAFISIQSAARKTDKAGVPPQNTTICPTCQNNPKREEKFRTTKTLTCNSPAQNRKRDPRRGGGKQPSNQQHNPKRELRVLDVQTDNEGNGMTGTKTVPKNFERADNSGNMFYSSKTSTVVITQPETTTSSGLTVATPATYHVTSYPDVRLPVNQKP
ncbi:xin actin-binding repeat-containing protein 1-like isoform X2 [Labrus mixtus]|uniref:xin actin-binding repeat-containing protein 1-like isoform X2 n=1 Tax=Labrus mixtus TaxID=508554 RepID=UPI0029BFE0CD|nr:xin actin-binding repeat-containing protein 1-like isoform X2 [Labrus mixtus]